MEPNDPAEARRQKLLQQLPPPKRRNNYKSIVKPSKHKADVSYAFDKFENLVVSFMTDYTTSQELVWDDNGDRSSDSSLIHNIRRKLQLMTHLLKQFESETQIHLLDVMNELVKLMQLQTAGLDEAREDFPQVRDIIRNYRNEILKPVVGPNSSRAMDRTLRLSRFIMNVKRLLNPTKEPTYHTNVPGYGRRVATGAGNKPVTKKSGPQSRAADVSTSQGKMLPKTLTEYLGAPMFPNIETGKPLFPGSASSVLSTQKNAKNSAYANMLIRNSSGTGSLNETPETDENSLSRTPFIWCAIRPPTPLTPPTNPQPHFRSGSDLELMLGPQPHQLIPTEMDPLSQAIHEYGIYADLNAKKITGIDRNIMNKRTGTASKKVSISKEKEPVLTTTSEALPRKVMAGTAVSVDNDAETETIPIPESANRRLRSKYKIASASANEEEDKPRADIEKKKFSFGATVTIPDVRKYAEVVQTGVDPKTIDLYGQPSKKKECSNSSTLNEQLDYLVGKTLNIPSKSRNTSKEPFAFDHSIGHPHQETVKTPNPLDDTFRGRSITRSGVLDNHNFNSVNDNRRARSSSGRRSGTRSDRDIEIDNELDYVEMGRNRSHSSGT